MRTMSVRQTTIEISKDYLHFNAAHFTIFSATEREDLHGHTFYVKALIDCQVNEAGLAFDYNVIKNGLKSLCDSVDEKVLLPGRSPYLALGEENGYVMAAFDDEKMLFLPRDALTLPVANVTVEELAPWFLERLRENQAIASLDLQRLELRVSSGPGQWAYAVWQGG